METNQHYTQLLQELKLRISQSRVIAARLVNREQLLLYYYIGKLLYNKITEQNLRVKKIAKGNEICKGRIVAQINLQSIDLLLLISAFIPKACPYIL